ncbi:MAG: type II toxin-antitoxin system VapC family toxin [Candidatus Korarchaeota archaeon]|nr:type II toxin-antitoxin system VapC family toxin [Candidatus Korarchaeota archaeon]
MIAIDSSVLVMYFSKEEGWEEAEKVIEQGVVTLELAVEEVANSLWKKVLREEMAEEDAIRIILDLASGDIIRIEDQGKYLEEAFDIAVKKRITIYDALFISLAKSRKLELVTCDRRQGRVAEEEGVKTNYLPSP